MTRVAVIEDDGPTSGQLRGWIEAACPGAVVHQWFTRDEGWRSSTPSTSATARRCWW
jgi:hypothetical protein